MPITPHIVVQGADRAASFYRDAFGAEEIERIPTPDGRLMSVQLRIGDGVLHVADEFAEMGVLAPPSVGGTPSCLPFALPMPMPCSHRRSLPARRFVSRCRTCSGAIATASLTIPSGTGGTSVSTCGMCRTTRSSPPLRQHSSKPSQRPGCPSSPLDEKQ